MSNTYLLSAAQSAVVVVAPLLMGKILPPMSGGAGRLLALKLKMGKFQIISADINSNSTGCVRNVMVTLLSLISSFGKGGNVMKHSFIFSLC